MPFIYSSAFKEALEVLIFLYMRFLQDVSESSLRLEKTLKASQEMQHVNIDLQLLVAEAKDSDCRFLKVKLSEWLQRGRGIGTIKFVKVEGTLHHHLQILPHLSAPYWGTQGSLQY